MTRVHAHQMFLTDPEREIRVLGYLLIVTMTRPPCWIFKNSIFLTADKVKRVILHHRAKFSDNCCFLMLSNDCAYQQVTLMTSGSQMRKQTFTLFSFLPNHSLLLTVGTGVAREGTGGRGEVRAASGDTNPCRVTP